MLAVCGVHQPVSDWSRPSEIYDMNQHGYLRGQQGVVRACGSWLPRFWGSLARAGCVTQQRASQ